MLNKEEEVEIKHQGREEGPTPAPHLLTHQGKKGRRTGRA